MEALMLMRLLADRRRALLIIAIIGLIVVSFVVRGELHGAPDKAAGAIYPVMSDAGVVYTAAVPAIVSWSKFVLFGLLFLLLRDPRQRPSD
jgi:hypothetical protein